MSISSGDPAEEVVRMMLSGAEVTLRLTANATKNLLAVSIALAKSRKKLCGKTNMKKMLKETRDLRAFHMSAEEFSRFKKEAKNFKLLYAHIRDDRPDHNGVDVILPVTELGRANMLFEKIHYQQEQTAPPQEKEADRKNVSRSEPDLSGTKQKAPSKESAEPTRTMNKKPSVAKRLEQYRQQIKGSQVPTGAKEKQRQTDRSK